ncbi:MAG: hypothetical protein LUI60_08065 [Clostridia bacterium]|nr:hypothetical protein [Clostridia bacterium]
MKKIINIVCTVLAVLLLCGAVGSVVYLFRDTDEPVTVTQIILDEEGIAF